jgi:hypothetical protein
VTLGYLDKLSIPEIYELNEEAGKMAKKEKEQIERQKRGR